jgi:hypothetical protein
MKIEEIQKKKMSKDIRKKWFNNFFKNFNNRAIIKDPSFKIRFN